MNELEIVKTHKAELLKKFGIKKIGLIGRRTGKDKGVLEFLVELEEGYKNFDNYIAITNFLEDRLARDVRLIPLKASRFYFRKGVFEEVFFVE